MKKKLMNSLRNSRKTLCTAGASIGAAFVAGTNMIMPTYAAEGEALAGNVISTMIHYVCIIFQFIGVLLAAWSVGMLVMAFKNEDADSKSRAIMLLVVSAILIGIKAIIKAVISAAGITEIDLDKI